MTTEDDFHAALDANPADWQTRLVFADWLEERDDPRAEGYRAIGVLQKWVRKFPTSPAQWYCTERNDYWGLGEQGQPTQEQCSLPMDWFDLVEDGRAISWRKGEHPTMSGVYLWHFNTRQEAEDAAALAFLKLPAECRAELLRVEVLQ